MKIALLLVLFMVMLPSQKATKIEEPARGGSSCPPSDSYNVQCFVYIDQCASHQECRLDGRGDRCCLVDQCGYECQPDEKMPPSQKATKTEEPARGGSSCPPSDSYGVQCVMYNDQCASHQECRSDGRGDRCCLVDQCGYECQPDEKMLPSQKETQTEKPARGGSSCPPSNSYDKECIAYIDQCDSHQACRSDGRGDRCCLVDQCGYECQEDEKTLPSQKATQTEEPARGGTSCPPSDSYNVQCIAYVDQCASHQECRSDGRGDRCCLVDQCGYECQPGEKVFMPPSQKATKTEEPARGGSSCPPSDSYNRQCIVYVDQCDSHQECRSDGRGDRCCLVDQCGYECRPDEKMLPSQTTAQTEEPARGGSSCPPSDSYGIQCGIYNDQCASHQECRSDGRGDRCCLVDQCGYECQQD